MRFSGHAVLPCRSGSSLTSHFCAPTAIGTANSGTIGARRKPMEMVQIWVTLAGRLSPRGPVLWERLTRYEVQQFGRKQLPSAGWRRCGCDLAARKLRNRTCIPDNRGNPRLPADLFRRTPDTLPLLDVEPFVQDRWDLPVARARSGRVGRHGPSPRTHQNYLTAFVLFSLADDPPIGPLGTPTEQSSGSCRGCLEIAKQRFETHSRQSLLSGQRVAGRGVDFVFEIIQAPSPVYRSCIGKFEMMIFFGIR